jgi:hypothetical protein
MLFTLDKGDGIDFTGKIKMDRTRCKIHMPKDWSIEKLHPDVLALATILIAYPFIDKGIQLPIGVSQYFHDLFVKETNKLIYPIDKNLKQRTAARNAVPGLAYSGGIDSSAALTILPDSTACVFLDRILPKELENKKKLYNKQAAYVAYDILRKKGRKEYIIKTDLEYIRNPRGFPVEESTTIPGLLLSDYIGLDSIATGTHLEHLYLFYHHHFFKERHYSIRWEKLFEGVDIILNQVVAGISEIGNMKIVLNSSNRSLAQWCMRGDINNPCLNCMKCFRKKLLEMTILRQSITNELLDQLFMITEARTMLKKFPINLENVMTYITSHYNGNHILMNLLKKRTRGDILETDWMEKWYMPAKSYISDKYYRHVKGEITKYLEVMNKDDKKNMRGWDINDVTESTMYQAYHKEFVDELIDFKKRMKQKK